MAIVIGAGMRIGAGMAISSGNPLRSEPIAPSESLAGDYQTLSGAAIDLMTETGSEDLNA